jgi:hypothetical protein
MSLNPSAAADWLTGRPPGEQDPGTTRFHALRGNSDLISLFQTGGNPKAITDLIAAAGNADAGRSQQVMNLFLRYQPGEVPDVLKPGVARAVGENIPMLLHAPKDVQERLLRVATQNGDGTANEGAALAFADASGKYLRTLVSGSEMRSENLYDVWNESSEVLTLLHDNLHEIDEDSEHAREIQNSILLGALDLAPIPGKGLLKDAAEHGKSILIRTFETYQNTHGVPPDPRSRIDFNVRYLIAQQYVAQHPGLVADGQNEDDVALGLATGRVENVPGGQDLKGRQKDEMYDFLNFAHGVRADGADSRGGE